jgi:hypothetical protein
MFQKDLEAGFQNEEENTDCRTLPPPMIGGWEEVGARARLSQVEL